LPRLPPVRLVVDDFERDDEPVPLERDFDFDFALLEVDFRFVLELPLRAFADWLAFFEPLVDFPPVPRFFGLVLVCAMGAFLEFSRGNRPGGRNRSSDPRRSCCVGREIGTGHQTRSDSISVAFSS